MRYFIVTTETPEGSKGLLTTKGETYPSLKYIRETVHGQYPELDIERIFPTNITELNEQDYLDFIAE